MSELLQARYRIASLDQMVGNPESLKQEIRHRLEHPFADALMKKWREQQGGMIVGPITETESYSDDYYGESTTFHMFAHVDLLPAPPDYQMIGGPYHNRIFKTDGNRYFLIPMEYPFEYPFGATSFPQRDESLRAPVAVYERVGDSTAYRFSRTDRV